MSSTISACAKKPQPPATAATGESAAPSNTSLNALNPFILNLLCRERRENGDAKAVKSRERCGK
jgi:hypothetical protein